MRFPCKKCDKPISFCNDCKEVDEYEMWMDKQKEKIRKDRVLQKSKFYIHKPKGEVSNG